MGSVGAKLDQGLEDKNTTDLVNSIEKLLDKDRLTLKDRENLQKKLSGAYNALVERDLSATNKRKLEEILKDARNKGFR